MASIIKIVSFLSFIILVAYIGTSTDESLVYYQIVHFPSMGLVFLGLTLLILTTNHYSDIALLLKRFIKVNPLEKKDSLLEFQKDIVNITNDYYKLGPSALLKEKKFQNSYLKEILEHLDSKIPIKDIKENLTRSVSRSIFELDRSLVILKLGKSEAPALGMFGTILGLVKLLDDLSDLSSLGPNMALALITTLYGVFSAFILGMTISILNERRKNMERSYGLLSSWLKVLEERKPSLYLNKETAHE